MVEENEKNGDLLMFKEIYIKSVILFLIYEKCWQGFKKDILISDKSSIVNRDILLWEICLYA